MHHVHTPSCLPSRPIIGPEPPGRAAPPAAGGGLPGGGQGAADQEAREGAGQHDHAGDGQRQAEQAGKSQHDLWVWVWLSDVAGVVSTCCLKHAVLLPPVCTVPGWQCLTRLTCCPATRSPSPCCPAILLTHCPAHPSTSRPRCPPQNQELAYKLKMASESSAATANWRHKYEEVQRQGALLHQKYQEKKALVERVGGPGWSGSVYVSPSRCIAVTCLRCCDRGADAASGRCWLGPDCLCCVGSAWTAWQNTHRNRGRYYRVLQQPRHAACWQLW